MSETFNSLEQDFTQYINSINRKITTLSNQSNEKKEAAISEAGYELKEVEKCIKQMELETLPFPENMRRELSQKIRKYKADYDGVKKKFKICEENYLEQKAKEKLMGARLEEEEDFKFNVHGGGLMEQQNRRLVDAKRTAYQTADTASSTTKELYRQTEVLGKNKDRLREMDVDLQDSNTLIGSMQRRIRKNKIILFSILGIVAVAVFLIVFSYF